MYAALAEAEENPRKQMPLREKTTPAVQLRRPESREPALLGCFARRIRP
jgi:hypothetical protein